LTVALVCPRSARSFARSAWIVAKAALRAPPTAARASAWSFWRVGDQEVVPDGRVRLQLGDVRLHGGQRIGVGQRHRYGEHPGDQPDRQQRNSSVHVFFPLLVGT